MPTPPILGLPTDPAGRSQRPPQRATGRIVVPLVIAGQFSAGDPAAMPDGYTRQITNMLLRPNRVDSRPPTVYDNLSGIQGLAYWDDITNHQRRFIAIDSTKLYKKATSGETWDAGITAAVIGLDARYLSFTNLLGRVYLAFDDGTGGIGRVYRYDGTNFGAAEWYAQGGAAAQVNAVSVAAFDSRVFLAGAPSLFANVAANGAYDFTTWTTTNITAQNITLSSGRTVCRLYPTSTGVQACSMDSGSFGAGAVLAGPNSTPTPVVVRWDFIGTSAQLTSVQDTNVRHRAATLTPVAAPGGAVPITIAVYLSSQRGNTTAYNVGDIMAFNLFRYRCTVAGTTAGAPPAFNTATNTTTVDGTVTWINEGADEIATQEFTVPSISEVQTWSTVVLSFNVPAFTNTLRSFKFRLKFWNSLYSSLPSLTAIDASLKDGKADSDPTKRNYGLQWTTGGFAYPFFNAESSGSATKLLADILWTEINDTSTIRATNYYNAVEISGTPTGIVACGGRLVFFKRFGYWVFAPTGDPDTPILPEGPGHQGIGCVAPTAIGTLDDEVFWIADREIYRLKIGYEPRPICGFAMREEIMDHGANWVEKQSTYKLPLLAVDERNREVWVYNQKGKLYVYHIGDEATPAVFRPYTPEKGQWTTIDLQGQEIQSMAYNEQTGEMEFSLNPSAGRGLVRLDPTSPLQDVLDNTNTHYPATATIIFKPIELFSPRYDAICEHIQLYHTCSTTQSQSGQTLQAFISLDRGQTYPNSITVNYDPTKEAIHIPIWTMGPSITLKLVMTGAIGPQIFSLSRAEAQLNVKRGEYPKNIATETAGNL